MIAASKNRRLAFLGSLLLTVSLLLVFNGPAFALEGPPRWKLVSVSNSVAEPGTSFDYAIEAQNVGWKPTDSSETVLTVKLAPGMTAQTASAKGLGEAAALQCTAADGSSLSEATEVRCANASELFSTYAHQVQLRVNVAPSATGVLSTSLEISGGGAPTVSTVDPTVVSDSQPPFGIDAFDMISSDEAGAPFTQAGGHPLENSTGLEFNTTYREQPPFDPESYFPVEPTKDIFVELPPGLVGNPTVVERCSLAELARTINFAPKPDCAPEAQVGTVRIRFEGIQGGARVEVGPISVFNLAPPPNAPARFGFNIAGVVVVLDAEVRSEGDYGLTVAGRNISQGLPVAGSTVNFWGVPASALRDAERHCPGQGYPHPVGNGGPSCKSTAPERPFLRNPTACTPAGVGLTTTVRADSWVDPGDFATASTVSHELPGFPYHPSNWGPEVGIEGCDDVPFSPGFSATPTTNAADSPSGLAVDLTVPSGCWDRVESTCQSDLREARVSLPEGMSVNPSSADGLAACSPSEIGLTTPVGSSPIHFDKSPVSCPDASKIGEVRIQTPLLHEPLKGFIYLAKQSENPFGSLLAMYLVAEGSGVTVKQAGRIEPDPRTGRLTTVFSDAPQTPFSQLEVDLYGGPRAALKTPPTCGAHTTQAILAPWSGTEPVVRNSSFAITSCPNSGFDPKLSAGTRNPLAASFSPFQLRLSRADGTEELSALQVTLPEGLIGKLAGIPYCPDSVLNAISTSLGTGAAQITSPSCPPASQIGTTTVGAGAGPAPFYTQSGRAYLSGPYKGAPLSVAVVTPAVAGPFDLGTVVVRNALRVDPVTTRVTAVSDPIPTILYGIPLDLRDVRINLDRPEFTLNPTDCDEMAIEARIDSSRGSSANRSERFQVAGCERLGFKPKLSLKLRGGTKRGQNPALRATLTMPAGGANIAGASVALPHSEFLDQSHIRTICTRVQFAADKCPPGSIYGQAKAFSPLLAEPLSGPVYLRSSSHDLPDLVMALKGQIEVEVIGRIDSHRGGIRTTFETVPDAPVSKFTLSMRGGKKGLLENSQNICAKTNRAEASFEAQNGRVAELRPALRARCSAKKRGR